MFNNKDQSKLIKMLNDVQASPESIPDYSKEDREDIVLMLAAKILYAIREKEEELAELSQLAEKFLSLHATLQEKV